MHLSAVVHCPRCDMFVELGTDDCPHAIELGKTHQGPVSSQLERIEQGLDRLLQSQAALAKQLDAKYDDIVLPVLESIEIRICAHTGTLVRIEAKLDALAKKPAKRAKTLGAKR